MKIAILSFIHTFIYTHTRTSKFPPSLHLLLLCSCDGAIPVRLLSSGSAAVLGGVGGCGRKGAYRGRL